MSDPIILESIRMVNYKRFTDMKVDLDPRLTVLSGKNGAGKSSALTAVRLILSWIIARLRNERGVGLYIPQIDVNNGAVNGCITAIMNGEPISVPNNAKPGLFKGYTLNLGPVKEYVTGKRQALTEDPDNATIPVFAMYGVRRAVVDIPVRTRSQDYTMFDAYEKCLDGAANFRGFFTWFRACEDWENQERARTLLRVEHPGLAAFRRAMAEFMPEYEDIRIERHPLAMMLRKGGEQLNAEQLSDGEKIYLALIGDLCHRLSLANPYGDPLCGDGIVLIDEIDLHLHPQWQSEIAAALTRAFPNIQFIVTTHSPHVINSVPTTSLRMIYSDGNITPAPYGYGMPSEVVLEDIMNLSDDIPQAVRSLINGFNQALTDGATDEAGRFLVMLSEAVPQHPDLPRMRLRLERMSR